MDIYVIPDTQVKPGVDTSYLYSIAAHIAIIKPTYIIMLGDWYDMHSLSYYDKGKKSHEVYNYIEDIEVGNEAVDYFFDMLDRLWKNNRKKCKRVILRGNHEDRIVKAFEFGDSNLREMIKRFPIDNSRWDKVVPFLKEYKVERCYFSHYFPKSGSGRPIPSAKNLVKENHKTCIAGHQQGFQYHEEVGEGGSMVHGIIAGSCYLHNEPYISPNNNKHFRGTLILRNVKGSTFDLEKHSLKNLMEKYK